MTPRRRWIGCGLALAMLVAGGLTLAPCPDDGCGLPRERIGVFLVVFGVTLTIAVLVAGSRAWWRVRGQRGRERRTSHRR